MRRAYLCCLFLLLFTRFSNAGLNRWTALGPPGGSVSALIVDPAHASTLYAAVSGGVYKSEDGAASWRRLEFADQPVYSLAISPAGIVYAASSEKFWMSSDGGAQWTNVTGPELGRFIAIAATTGHTVAITDKWVVAFDNNYTWDANFWDPYTNGLPGSPDHLAASQNGDVLAWRAGDPSGAKFITTDGWNWQLLHEFGDIVDFGDDGALYVTDGTTGWFSSLSIHKSADGGRTWTDIPLICIDCPDAPARISSLHVTASGQMFLVKRTEDERLLLEEYESARLVASHDLTGFFPGPITSDRHSGRVYAGTSARGVLTLDGGQWIAANNGLPGMPLSDVAVAPLDSSLLYAASDYGVALRSTDGGRTWETLDVRGRRIAVDPNASNSVYISDFECSYWPCPDAAHVRAGDGLKKSIDSGKTWSVVRPQASYWAAIAPSDSSTIYATLADGMFRSSDGGATWNSIDRGISDNGEFYYYQFYTSMPVIDPNDARTVYIERPDGLYKTVDGSDWSRISLSGFIEMIVDPSSSNRLYAGNINGMSISEDGGVSWRPAGLANEYVIALAISPAEPYSIYAGTVSGLVYRSDDRAETWQRFDDGLPHSMIRSLSVDASGRFLAVATERGVFAYEAGTQVVPLAERARLDDAAVVIPIAGSSRGANARWSSDLSIRNNASGAQDVTIAWLPQSADDASFFNVNVPAGQQVDIPNVVDKLNATGTGSILLFGASLDGSVRICSHRDDRSPVCESIPGIGSADLDDSALMTVSGLRQDGQFRSSVGIVNLDASSRAFHVTLTGERQSKSIDVVVPPYHSSRVWFDSDFGSLTVHVTSIGPPSRWIAYGSVVDNASDAGTTIIGSRR